MSEPSKNVAAMRQVVLGGLAFGVAMGVFLGVMTGSGYYGFHGGFFSGFAFGWALKRFLGITGSAPAAPPLDARAAGFDGDETVLEHGPANHFKGLEGVGGKLFLTERRLRFRSHGFNVQNHDESYPLEDIVAVEPARTLGIIPNGLLVQLRDGRRERFVVTARGSWVASIRRRLGEASPGS
jgi:hypothetical protein